MNHLAAGIWRSDWERMANWVLALSLQESILIEARETKSGFSFTLFTTKDEVVRGGGRGGRKKKKEKNL